MRAAQLFELWLPEAFGWPALHPLDFLAVVKELSAADGSAGWCAMIGSAVSLLAGSLDETAAREIFANRAIVVGAVNATGKAVAAVIGSRAAGPTAAALGTANGCSAAAWCMMGRTRAVWQAAARRRGSCASRNRRSSHRYLARRRSTRHWQPRLRDRQRVRAGQPDDAGVRSHGRAAGDALSHADCQSVSVGPSRSDAPRRACRDRGVRRTSGDESTSGLADGAARQVVAQSAVGRADALLPAARSGFADAIEMQLREVAAGRTPSLAGRAGVRSATAFAGEASLRAIELVYNAAGGGAILASGRLDRDVRVAVQHIGLSTNA